MQWETLPKHQPSGNVKMTPPRRATAIPHALAAASWITLLAGTAVSALSGVMAGLWFHAEGGIVVGLVMESVTLSLSLWARVSEAEERLRGHLEDAVSFVRLSQRISKTDDPLLTERYQDLLHAQHELSEGRYDLRSLEAVYDDDQRSIRYLEKHDVLRSICPVAYEEAAIRTQFGNRSYRASIIEHISAAQRDVTVIRICIFVKHEHYKNEFVQSHLSELEKKAIKCYCIVRNDPEYKQAQQIDSDFVVFGERKVSVGTIDPTTGTVNGARVFSDHDTVKKYIRNFDTLVRIAQRHEVNEGTGDASATKAS